MHVVPPSERAVALTRRRAPALGAYYPDGLHDDRFILIGYSRQHRVLYVVHAEVQTEVVRIISARRATKHEKTRYEKD